MVSVIILIVVAWIALVLTVIIHEFGHFGKVEIVKLFPFPIAIARRAMFQYGGLIANAATSLIVMLQKPSGLFFNMLGLVSGLYFLAYITLGLYNKDKIRVNGTISFDEVISFLKAQGASMLLLPERVEVVTELPLTGAGKAHKQLLKADIAQKVEDEKVIS